MRLAGQVAIVTAAAGAGIGQATARVLAREGAAVVICDRHAARTAQAAEAIAVAHHVPSLPVVCDVTNRRQLSEMVERVIERFGHIDILVNNAGFDLFMPLEQMDLEELDRVVGINLMGTMYSTRLVLPWMIKRRTGKIVNLSSIAAYSPDSGDSAAYAASKAAIEAFTRNVAREVGKYGIRVNAVAPSVTLNPFLEKQMPAASISEITGKMPLGNIRPEEQAEAILFLLSDEAAKISGATLNVTAGY